MPHRVVVMVYVCAIHSILFRAIVKLMAVTLRIPSLGDNVEQFFNVALSDKSQEKKL